MRSDAAERPEGHSRKKDLAQKNPGVAEKRGSHG